jgi:hypothetical protein
LIIAAFALPRRMQRHRDKPIGRQMLRTPTLSQQITEWIGQTAQSLILKAMNGVPHFILKNDYRVNRFNLEWLRAAFGAQPDRVGLTTTITGGRANVF